jgi:threonine synthase
VNAMVVCTRCGRTIADPLAAWRCSCGGTVEIAQDAADPFADPRADRTMWRYREALHLAPDAPAVTLGEGGTPVVSVPWAGASIDLKLDQLCPTGSYKDRGAALMIARLAAAGATAVVEDSSGNAGAAVAAYAARAGLACTIYVPARNSPAKQRQIRAYGAEVVAVDGSRADVAAACERAVTGDTVYASHNRDPFFIEGVKTIAYELYEHYEGVLPAWVVAPTGYGSVALGLARGFLDLVRWGRIDRLPRLVLVQAAACAPVAIAHAAGASHVSPLVRDVDTRTVAEGIECRAPIRGDEILRAVTASGGRVITVEEADITSARNELARLGIWVEPTSAVVPAAIAALIRDDVLDDGDVVGILTGHGLKSPSPA